MKHFLCGFFAAAFFIFSGCDGDQRKEANVIFSAERFYAEAVMAPAEEIGEGWDTADKAVVAYSRYDRLDRHDGEGDGIPGFKEKADKLVTEKGPCRIIAAVAYTNTDDKRPVAYVNYYYNQYRALPLGDNDPLPQDPNFSWTLGDDGIAIGQLTTATKDEDEEDSPENVDSEKGEVLSAGENEVEAKQDGEGDGEPKVKEENANAETPPENDSAKTDAKQEALPESEKLPEPEVAAVSNRHVICAFAANGIMVEIEVEAGIETSIVEPVIAAARKRLAAAIEREQQLYKELAEKRAQRNNGIKLEEKANPSADVYWKLLGTAMGTFYETEY